MFLIFFNDLGYVFLVKLLSVLDGFNIEEWEAHSYRFISQSGGNFGRS